MERDKLIKGIVLQSNAHGNNCSLIEQVGKKKNGLLKQDKLCYKNRINPLMLGWNIISS